MVFLDIVKTIGKGAARGGKWALDHAEQIADATQAAANTAEAGFTICNQISDAKERKRIRNQESCEQLGTNNEMIFTSIEEIENGIAELEKIFETSIQEIEQKYEDTYHQVEELKFDLNKSVSNLQSQLNQYKDENVAYQKLIKRKLIMSNVLGSVGIIIAILVAILV